jgi:outer membrane lipoprotein-sorting protein
LEPGWPARCLRSPQSRCPNYRPAGEENRNGHKALVYSLKKLCFRQAPLLQEEESAKLWVDRATGLPVEVQTKTFSPGDSSNKTIVMHDFQWNVEIDQELFQMKAPEDFKVWK